MSRPTEEQEDLWRRADEEVRKKLPPGVKLVRTLRAHTSVIGRIAWSPDGRMLASPSWDRTIRLWDVETGECLHVMQGHKETAYAVAFDPKGRFLASGSRDNTIKLWEPSSGQILHTLEGHGDRVWDVAFDQAGCTLASGSRDSMVKLWEPARGTFLRTLEGHQDGVLCVAFDASGCTLATGGDDRTVHLWEPSSSKPLRRLGGHHGSVYVVAFDMSGGVLASGSADETVKIWEPASGRLLRTLEGHTHSIHSVAFLSGGRLLFSKGGDDSVRAWNIDTGSCVATIPEPGGDKWPPGLSLHPRLPLLATVGSDPGTQDEWRERVIHVYELDPAILLSQPVARTVNYTSAKVVLVGESNVGKSFLAHRIATGSAPEQGTINSTHGMRFWPLEAESSSSSAKVPTEQRVLPSAFTEKLFDQSVSGGKTQRRDIVLWDMGGQAEYRLIHQLFLHDTTVALVLLDPTRGATAFKEAEAWNKSLEKQLRGRAAVKLLVGAKVDQPSKVIDQQGLDRLRKECGFADYCETSAITGRGVAELCEAVARAIDWDGLGKTSRPELFQRIRDEIAARRKRGEVLLNVGDLERSIVKQDSELQETVDRTLRDLASKAKVEVYGGDLTILSDVTLPGAFSADTMRELDLVQRTYEELRLRWLNQKLQLDLTELHQAIIAKDVGAVVEQLASQGVIVRSKVSTGEQVLVLQVQEIERYAGSLILATRNNPRGVPALELRAMAQEGFSLPGIGEKERLSRAQEKAVVECTVQLMLEHGICFQHEGLLIFPSLFAPALESAVARLPHTVSLYYDFAGAIDNIYASLVAWLVLAKEFGKVRLWSDRAEFEVKDGGLCGLVKRGRPGGFAHVDVYFEAETPEPRRKEFISFVEDHLARNGVEIHEHVAIKCACGHEFAEETLRQRIARGDKDVVCPVCETRHSITEGAAVERERDPQITQHTWALRTQIDKLREELTKQVARVLAKADDVKREAGPIRLLHLSDLHFTKETPVTARLQWLLEDLKQGGGVGVKELDYLIISGDFTEKGCTEGFEKAYEFVSGLTQEFGLSAERCIFVPGNHDVPDLREAYEWRDKPDGLKLGEWVKQGDIFLARNAEKYPLRLKPFSDSFYHKFLQRPYPLNSVGQGMAIPFWETGIQFLALNSCWQIDQFHRKRSEVRLDAVANALREAEKQEQEARKAGHAKGPLLRIAVWHHAVAGVEPIADLTFLGHLQKGGVRLGLHGHVHELTREVIGHWDEKHRLHIVGSGSFSTAIPGAAQAALVPRLYNLIEIRRDLKGARVRTRQQPKPDGPWKGFNEWPRPDGGEGGLPYYDITWD